MQQPVTAEEARIRRLRLQQRVLQDAGDRLILSTFVGFSATVFTLPLDRLKMIQQCIPEYKLNRTPVKFTGGFGAALHIWKNEGLTKFWRGITPAMAFAFPTIFTRQLATLNFAYDVDNNPSLAGSFGRGFAVALAASTIGTLTNICQTVYVKMATDLRHPREETFLDEEFIVERTRRLEPTQFKYRNWIHTFRQLYSVNGSTKFIHGAMPYFLFNMVHYSALFSLTGISTLFGLDSLAPVTSTLIVSALTTLLCHPFDTIRTRMMHRLPTDINYTVKPYQNTFTCMKYIWDHEGMRGFMRGGGNALNIFFISLITSSLTTALVNGARRDKLEREYIHKMKEYSHEERAHALAQSRLQRDKFMNHDIDTTI